MSNGINILGGGNNSGSSGKGGKNGEIFWELEELQNAFYFFVRFSNTEPFFVEFDELTAAGSAYKTRGPLNMMDMLEILEELSPGFAGINLPSDARLIRRRLSRSPGLSLEIPGESGIFMKEATLKTINFLDFYRETLKPELDSGLDPE